MIKLMILFQYSIHNLTDNTLYEIKVSGGTRSLYYDTNVTGIPSASRKVSVSNCGKKQPRVQYNNHGLGAEVIASILCASFAFILSIMAFIIWR